MVNWHNQSSDFMHCILPDGKKIAMPRYYKQKIYDEHTRIIFGQLGLQKMQEQKNRLLSKYNVTPQQYEERLRVQKNARYQKQIQISKQRQKQF